MENILLTQLSSQVIPQQIRKEDNNFFSLASSPYVSDFTIDKSSYDTNYDSFIDDLLLNSTIYTGPQIQPIAYFDFNNTKLNDYMKEKIITIKPVHTSTLLPDELEPEKRTRKKTEKLIEQIKDLKPKKKVKEKQIVKVFEKPELPSASASTSVFSALSSTSASSSSLSSAPSSPYVFNTFKEEPLSSQGSIELQQKLKNTQDIFLTTISETDSLLSKELDPKKILCNIYDWVMLGTISEKFGNLLFNAVEKLIKVHIKKEQEKNPNFSSTILLTYLSALQLRMEAAFLDDDVTNIVNLPYSNLLRKLFGEEVSEEVKTEGKGPDKKIVKDKKTGYTKTQALSVRDEYLAAVTNKTQCDATAGDWEKKPDIKCWIVDVNLRNYAPHGCKKLNKAKGVDEDMCPADPGVDCEHIGGLRFQLIHANTVQTGIKRFKLNKENYKDYIRMFYDWSFHGPNVIKNDDEWLEFNEETGFFTIAMNNVKPGKYIFEKTLQDIYEDASTLKNKYGCACINMKKKQIW